MQEENERLLRAQMEVRALRLDTSQLEAKVEALESDYQHRFQALPIDIQRRLIASFEDLYTDVDLGDDHKSDLWIETAPSDNIAPGEDYALHSDIKKPPKPPFNHRYKVAYDDDSDVGDRPVSSIGLSESPDSVTSTSREEGSGIDLWTTQVPRHDAMFASGMAEDVANNGDKESAATRKHTLAVAPSLRPKTTPVPKKPKKKFTNTISANNGTPSGNLSGSGKRSNPTRISSRMYTSSAK